MATASVNKEYVSELCTDIIKHIKDKRAGMKQKEIDRWLEPRPRWIFRWLPPKVRTLEKATELAEQESDTYGPPAFTFYGWSDLGLAEDLLRLCSICELDYVNLNQEEAKACTRWSETLK